MNTVNYDSLLINFVCYDSPSKQWELRRSGVGISSFWDSFMVCAERLAWPESFVATVRKRFELWNLDRVLSICHSHEITVVDYDSDRYPQKLKDIYDPPLILYCKGLLDYFSFPQLAIVGPRKASVYGLDVAQKFSAELCEFFCICSGLAEGVDAKAHATALDRGAATLAVLGNGCDVIYPSSNRQLYTRISREALLVSEYPLGVPALARHFPQRNRIVSGLSSGVLVCEAGLRSGSLITARMALEQGREVFVVPGSIFSENSKGAHSLLKDGAHLVCDSTDITEVLSFTQSLMPLLDHSEDHLIVLSDLDDQQARVLSFLSNRSETIDVISSELGLAIQDVLSCLAFFEYKEWVETLPDQRLRLIPKWSVK